MPRGLRQGSKIANRAAKPPFTALAPFHGKLGKKGQVAISTGEQLEWGNLTRVRNQGPRGPQGIQGNKVNLVNRVNQAIGATGYPGATILEPLVPMVPLVLMVLLVLLVLLVLPVDPRAQLVLPVL